MKIDEIYKLIIFSLISVIYLFFISKILGKKQIAQLEFIDYVMGISIGSIAAEMATDVGETPFYYYLIGMTIFMLFDIFVSYLGRKGPIMKHFLKGKPEVIIYEGELQYKTLKKSKLDVNDVISMCREKNYFDISDIAYAIFETSGEISILPKGNLTPVVVEDIKAEYQKAELPVYLIIDGKISYSSLTEINKDEKWLYEKSKLNKKTIKKVILGVYDKDNDKIDIQYKD